VVKLSIIGSGYVGTAIGIGFLELGNSVIFHDISVERAKKLRKRGLDATTDLDYAVKNSDISFVTVPTPTLNGRMDTSFVEVACKSLARVLKNKEYHVVVIKSTVLPLTTERLIIPILERFSGKRVGEGIGIAVNPEFMTEISGSWTKDASHSIGFKSEPRIIIGELNPGSRAGDLVEGLYKPLGVPIFRVSLREAEYAKYASNAFLAMKISYWNERFLECKELDVDSHKIAEIVGMDPRIGRYGTVHGKAFGGKCLPKDLEAFIAFIREELGIEPSILSGVKEVNDRMRQLFGVRE
jgi:UDPglucose 6-dehydrogenase